MPTLKLKSINYVVTGDRQQLLNVDFENSSSERESGVSYFTDTESGTFEDGLEISSTFAYDKIEKENKNQYGFVFFKEPNLVVRPLFDVKDVALKSAIAEQIHVRKDTDAIAERQDIPMYFPHLKKNPIGFVQIEDYAYGISDKTPVGPVIKRTTLFRDANSAGNSSNSESDSYGNPEWNFFLNPYDKYGSDARDPSYVENLIPIYLYTPLSNLFGIVSSELSSEYSSQLDVPQLSAEALSALQEETNSHVSSYYAFVSFFKDRGQDVLSSLFKPAFAFKNVEHNYVFEVPLRTPEETNNDYRNACVNADMIMAKNAYDSLYNMNLSSVGDFSRIRDYVSLNSAGGKMFLTYFDDEKYGLKADSQIDLSSTYETYDGSGAETGIEERKPQLGRRRDYVKVECIDAINRFISTTMHKANLYSTRVYGLNDLLKDRKYDSDKNDSYRRSIKRDIDNSIRRIVKSFTPAHTQYFGTVEYTANRKQNESC